MVLLSRHDASANVHRDSLDQLSLWLESRRASTVLTLSSSSCTYGMLPGMDKSDPSYKGQSGYNAAMLAIYDVWVLKFMTKAVWKVPVALGVDRYRQHMGSARGGAPGAPSTSDHRGRWPGRWTPRCR
jgi:hypothetical protein